MSLSIVKLCKMGVNQLRKSYKQSHVLSESKCKDKCLLEQHLQYFDSYLQDSTQLELLREFMKLQKEMMIMLLSMLEGKSSKFLIQNYYIMLDKSQPNKNPQYHSVVKFSALYKKCHVAGIKNKHASACPNHNSIEHLNFHDEVI